MTVPAQPTSSIRRTALFAVSALASLLPAARAADWPQWRGPGRDGVVPGFQAPAAWSAASFVKQWSLAVGEGHASPIVVGDRVYQFSREGDREVMRCLALADGKPLWRDAYAAPYSMNLAARGHGKGPKATPAVADGRVFALGIAGALSAYDAATGRVLWRKTFAGEFKHTAPDFGAATSPLVDGDVVIVHVGGEDQGALTAFDTATGAVRWRWTGDGPAYASPVIATFGGIRQLVTQSQERCLAISPADGRLLWEIPFSTSYDQNSVTPIVAGDLVVFGGVGKPTFAVKVSGTSAVRVWEARDITLYMSTPVLSGPRLFGMTDKHKGSLFSLDLATGRVLWKTEGKLGANAALLDLGSAVLVAAEPGYVSVHAKAGDTLPELAKIKVGDSPLWAHPAVAGQRLLFKDAGTLHVYAVAGAK